jgi:hypothetical protein
MMSKSNDGGKSTRIKPGERRNPAGRPRRSPAGPTPAGLEVLRDRTVKITKGGAEREVSMKEGLEHQTLRSAFRGSRTSIREVLKWIKRRNAARPSQQRLLPLIKQDCASPLRVDDAVLLLRIASVPSGRAREKGQRFLQLEPWVVREALERLSPKRLAAGLINDILRQTREGEALRQSEGDA